MTQIHGSTDAGWEAVADAFRRNFDELGEIGGACCVYLDGRPVVDLWGGVADERSGKPWSRDTVVLVFSTTKGATAMCAHLLVQRGELDLDARVSDYWPEFAAEGKHATRVRWLLSHQAGLPGITERLSLEEACSWEPVIEALQRAKPLWEPGTKQAYHPLTYGFLVGEVVRRVTGRSLGRFFADEIASPFALDSWIGLPAELEPRVAHLVPPSPDPDALDALANLVLAHAPDSLAVPPGGQERLKAMWTDPTLAGIPDALGGAFPPDLVTEEGGHNSRIVRASEHPGSGLVTDARSLARMYAATIGEVDGLRLLTPETVERMCVVPASPPYGVPPDLERLMMEVPLMSLSLGFQRPTVTLPLLGARSFGHLGAGGSLGFADVDTKIAFGYVMNRMALNTATVDNLIAAVAACGRR